MAINNRIAALIYRIIFIISVSSGIIASLYQQGHFSLTPFAFFTVQSNFLCLLVILYCIYDTIIKMKDSGIRGENYAIPVIKGGATVAISVTFLVFHFILLPFMNDVGDYLQSYNNISLHYINPLLFIGDWLLFDKKGVFNIKDPFKWLLIPMAYFIFAMIRAEIGDILPLAESRYPYPFIDIDKHGWMVLLYLPLLGLFFLALGYLMVFIDRITHKYSRNQN